jgi:hypothetical protein
MEALNFALYCTPIVRYFLFSVHLPLVAQFFFGSAFKQIPKVGKFPDFLGTVRGLSDSSMLNTSTVRLKTVYARPQLILE